MVIAVRGKCTFATKARNAQKAMATSLLIVNNEPGLLHPPGPDGKDLGMSSSIIRNGFVSWPSNFVIQMYPHTNYAVGGKSSILKVSYVHLARLPRSKHHDERCVYVLRI